MSNKEFEVACFETLVLKAEYAISRGDHREYFQLFPVAVATAVELATGGEWPLDGLSAPKRKLVSRRIGGIIRQMYAKSRRDRNGAMAKHARHFRALWSSERGKVLGG